jgi:hypothetical protein
MRTSKRSIKHLGVWVGAGLFVMALGAPVVHADETVIEKRTQESHSYKVEESAPVVNKVVTERTETKEIPPPAVVEKRTTVETVPAPPPVVERRTTTTTTHTED